MSRRRTVSDYAGNEIWPGDLINSSSRRGNRVRAADYIVLKVTTIRAAGRVLPELHVLPTGSESGFSPRRSPRIERISNEHARVLIPGYAEIEKGKVVSIQGVSV